jgi:hypothetical protein
LDKPWRKEGYFFLLIIVIRFIHLQTHINIDDANLGELEKPWRKEDLQRELGPGSLSRAEGEKLFKVGREVTYTTMHVTFACMHTKANIVHQSRANIVMTAWRIVVLSLRFHAMLTNHVLF